MAHSARTFSRSMNWIATTSDDSDRSLRRSCGPGTAASRKAREEVWLRDRCFHVRRAPQACLVPGSLPARSCVGRVRIAQERAAFVAVRIAILLCLALLRPAAGQAVETVASDWSLVPAGVSVGESFRLLFVSSVSRDATSTTIGDYDTHVQSVAATSNAATGIQSSATHFSALASTSAVDARDHTSTTYTASDKGVPIYWLGGEKVADDYEDFLSGDWSSNVPTDESGTAIATSVEVFTGSSDDGTKIANLFLGAAGNAVRVGNPGAAAMAFV